MSQMLENSSNTVEKMMNDVGVVVKDHFSRLIFKMNEENKSVQSSIDYIKNMPIVLKLEQELKEARDEIDRLNSLLGNDTSQTIKLKMQELNEKDSMTSYDEISKLVSDKIEQKTSVNDFMTMYLNNQESDDDDDEPNTKEEKTPIEMPYKHFLGLPKLYLDGAECSNESESESESESEGINDDNGEVVKQEALL